MTCSHWTAFGSSEGALGATGQHSAPPSPTSPSNCLGRDRVTNILTSMEYGVRSNEILSDPWRHDAKQPSHRALHALPTLGLLSRELSLRYDERSCGRGTIYGAPHHLASPPLPRAYRRNRENDAIVPSRLFLAGCPRIMLIARGTPTESSTRRLAGLPPPSRPWETGWSWCKVVRSPAYTTFLTRTSQKRRKKHGRHGDPALGGACANNS